MLEQIGKHGGLDLTIQVKGDLEVDEHHTIEDTAIWENVYIRHLATNEVSNAMDIAFLWTIACVR